MIHHRLALLSNETQSRANLCLLRAFQATQWSQVQVPLIPWGGFPLPHSPAALPLFQFPMVAASKKKKSRLFNYRHIIYLLVFVRKNWKSNLRIYAITIHINIIIDDTYRHTSSTSIWDMYICMSLHSHINICVPISYSFRVWWMFTFSTICSESALGLWHTNISETGLIYPLSQSWIKISTDVASQTLP